MRGQVIAFALGVVLLQLQPALPGVNAACLLLVPLFWMRRVGGWWRLVAWVLCLALGFFWAGWRAELRLADELPGEWEGRDVEIVGVIAGLPQESGRGLRFEMAVDRTLTAEARIPSRLMLSWYRGRNEPEAGELPTIHAGERWRLTVRLKRPHGNANPQAFNYEAWLLERNIRATGYVRPAATERLADLVWEPGYVIERFRDKVRERFEQLLPAARYPYAGVLLALAIGDQKAITGGELHSSSVLAICLNSID